MPKSKHGKGKYYRQAKKSPAPVGPPGAVKATSPAAANAPKPTATAPAAPSATKSAAASAAMRASQYIYITGDLKRIGIVTGIVAVILVILFVILH